MGFCFGFYSNNAGQIAGALAPFKECLTIAEGAPDGWGLAYYQAGQPLLRKQPKPYSEALDFTATTDKLKSNIILGHARQATVGGQRTENTHPFRFRNWTFSHIGNLEKFEQIKEDLLRSVPDFIRRNIRGKTDSEHLFHLYLSFLNDTGKLDDPRVPPEAAAQALTSTLTYVERLITDCGGQPLKSCCMISNGHTLMAARRGIELNVIRKSSYDQDAGESQPEPLKAVLLLSGAKPKTPGWEEVADQTIATVDSDLNIKYS